MARDDAGLSRVGLAHTLATRGKAVAADPTTIRRWEADEEPGPRLAQVVALAEITGVDFAWLAIGRRAA